MITTTNNMDIQTYTHMLIQRGEFEYAEIMQEFCMPGSRETGVNAANDDEVVDTDPVKDYS